MKIKDILISILIVITGFFAFRSAIFSQFPELLLKYNSYKYVFYIAVLIAISLFLNVISIFVWLKKSPHSKKFSIFSIIFAIISGVFCGIALFTVKYAHVLQKINFERYKTVAIIVAIAVFVLLGFVLWCRIKAKKNKKMCESESSIS